MTDEPAKKTRVSRKALELAALKLQNKALEERLSKLEAAGSNAVVAEMRAERSDRLQRELDEANRQIEHLKLQQTPTSGVPYTGWVQAKEDLWDGQLVRKGPKDGQEGEVFQISLPDYWPGCPFVPVIITRQRDDGTYVVAPHPDFQSH